MGTKTRPSPLFADAPIQCRAGIQMEARDGTSLVMDIWFPRGGEGAGPYPVVVERTPYGRSNPRLKRLGEVLAARGIAVVLQDVRGRGASGGRFHLMMNHPDEGMDGADTLSWVHSQPWCNGRIGTMGLSFSSANQHAAALNHPDGLVAQVQMDSGVNYYRRMFRYHGAFNVGVALPWVLTFGQEIAPSEKAAAALSGMRETVSDWIDELPFVRGETAMAEIPDYEEIYFKILESSDFSDYWRNPTIYLEGRWDEYPTDIAMLLVSGWFSHHCRANLEKFSQFSRRLAGPTKLIIGPWIHSNPMPDSSVAGDADFGQAALELGPDERLRAEWLETHLVAGSKQGGAKPEIHYFTMGTGDGHITPEGRIFHGGEWRSANEWPLAETQCVPFYLSEGGQLTDKAPSHGVEPSEYTFDPDDPCPGIGGVNVAIDHMPDFVLPGPRVQKSRPDFAACRGRSGPLRERQDLVVFRSAPLDRHLEVTGSISLRLFVSSSALDTDFHVRLIDEYPGGVGDGSRELLLSEGILRMRYRDDRAEEDLIEPGRVYDVTIELGAISNIFKQGHRIVLHLTSAAFPQYDVNPNTGEPLGRHTHKIVAHQRIYHDPVHPSALVLPVQPGKSWRIRKF